MASVDAPDSGGVCATGSPWPQAANKPPMQISNAARARGMERVAILFSPLSKAAVLVHCDELQRIVASVKRCAYSRSGVVLRGADVAGRAERPRSATYRQCHGSNSMPLELVCGYERWNPNPAACLFNHA